MGQLNSTHQLKVYSNIFTDEPCEVRELPDGVILGEWLAANIEGFDPDNTQLTYSLPFSHPVHANVECYFVPEKGAVKSVTKIFTKTIGFIGQIFGLKKPKMPNIKNTQIQQGDELSLASGNNQTVRYGEPIREAFGRNKIVPDYLVPPRRYFKNKKEHWMETLLCVGVGEYEMPGASILTSNSPIAGLGGDNYARAFAPNANLAGEPAARWWHTSTEVGPTSTGGSGLPLLPSTTATRVAPSGNYLFSGKTITPTGGQRFPSDWEPGMYLNIDAFGSYAVSGSTLSGSFSGLQVAAGDSVSLSGWVTGNYSVQSFTPATSTDGGTPSTWTAQASPELDYEAEPARFIINAGGVTASITINDDYISQSELISAINSKLSVTPLSGIVKVSSGLIITEQPNYAARVITVSNITGSIRLFGSIDEANLTTEVGQARVAAAPAKLALNGFRYAGANVRLSIKKRGESFFITGATPTLVTIDRVDALGNSEWLGWQQGFNAGNDSSIQLDPNSIEGGWAGTFSATPAAELADILEFDVFFPQGLVKYNDDGKPQSNSAAITFRYREDNSKGWSYFSKTYTQTEKDQIGFTERITLPRAMRVKECQLKRDTAESTEQNDSNKAEWFGLRARMIKTKTRYPGLTTIAVKLSGDVISSESNSQISVVATRKLNGAPTRSIKDAVNYIARTTDVDQDEMSRLHAIWEQRGDSFDFQFNSFTTIADAVRKALSVGFSEMTIKRGKLTPVREAAIPAELLQAYSHTYSLQNTTGPIVEEIAWPDDDDPDAYDVEYMDATSWRVETVRCQQPGNTGDKVEKVKADGITSRAKAYQWGMRQLMTALTESTSYNTKTELDAKNNWYGDLVNFVQEIPDWSQTALVASVSSNKLIITSTEPLNWVDSKPHLVSLLRADGTMSDLRAATKIDDWTLTIDREFQLTIRPHETTLFFGVADRLSNPAIVRSIKPKGYTTSISAVAYNPDKHLYDDAPLPPDV